MVRLKHGQTTINLGEKFLLMVTNLTTKVTQLQSDNTVLKAQISKLQDILSTKSCHTEAAAGTLSSKPGAILYKDILACNQHQ
jgi:cell division protein FtsB